MSLSEKRKAPLAAAGPSSIPAASSSKRVRIDEPSRRQRKREETDFFDGDPEIEEEDRRRIRKDQKSGRIDDRGDDLSESDESDDNGADLFNADHDDSDAEADAGSHRRRAEKKRSRGDAAGAAGDDDDEDMFDVRDEDDGKPGSNKAGDKGPTRDRYLKLGELEEGQEFGSKNRSTLDAEDDDAELLRGSGDQDDDDLDPELELEDDQDQDDDDQTEHRFVDLNALAERSPPTSPGGTPLPTSSNKSKSKKHSKVKPPKVTGFNMKEEMRTGKFDADGNYHENQRDPHAQHDAWLTGNYSKSKILDARKAQQKREQEARDKEKAAQQADGDEDEVKMRLVEYMHRAETVQRTLQRLGKTSAERRRRSSRQNLSGRKRQTKQRQTSNQSRISRRCSCRVLVDWISTIRPTNSSCTMFTNRALSARHMTLPQSLILRRHQPTQRTETAHRPQHKQQANGNIDGRHPISPQQQGKLVHLSTRRSRSLGLLVSQT